MASLAAIGRERKKQLRDLMTASRRLDAAQETLEREIKRLVNRKKSVPEVADAQRLTQLATGVNNALGVMAKVISDVSRSWGTT